MMIVGATIGAIAILGYKQEGVAFFFEGKVQNIVETGARVIWIFEHPASSFTQVLWWIVHNIASTYNTQLRSVD